MDYDKFLTDKVDDGDNDNHKPTHGSDGEVIANVHHTDDEQGIEAAGRVLYVDLLIYYHS